MTAEDDARALEILKAYEIALRSGTVGAWGELNWRFHSTLYTPANRPFTLDIVRKLHQHSDRYQRLQLTLARGETRITEEHRAIAAAVRRRDVRVACTLMRDHILGAGRRTVTVLEAYREPSVRRSRKATR
jgi:DNA-binding GntR family transcriptional regulator